jgi:Domain of unknown function (DUF4411)
MYCIDTSSLVEWWFLRYPPSIFPSLRARIEGLISSGRLVTSEFVVQELGVKGDELFNWAKAQASFSVSTSQDVLNEAASIVVRFPALVDPGAQETQADPFLIALARTRGLTVVTEETLAVAKRRRRRQRGIYIPDVCAALNVRCIALLAMIQREGWTF